MQIRGQLIPTLNMLNQWPRFRLRLFFEGAVIGMLSGTVISFFRWALEAGTRYREHVYTLLVNGDIWLNLAWFCVLLASAFILYGLTVLEPMSAGSGIPQVKGVILGRIKMRWFRILWVKLVGGILGIGLGLSLGREGPSIQIGAVTAQGLSRTLGRTRMEERYLITAGASAGLAAAFNAPLAGVIFALEELHRNFSGAVLAPSMAAALMATIVSRVVFGHGAVFQFGDLPIFAIRYMWSAVLVAAVMGVAGYVFNFGLLHMNRFYNLPVFFRPYTRVVFALICAGILGYVMPDVLGGGNDLINKFSTIPISLTIFLALLIGKFIFTLISYGCGVPGGFFLPMLVLGALSGATCAIVLIQLGLIPANYFSNIVVVSMAAFFAASVHSPITGTILIMEMTGSYPHLLVLCLGSMIALVVARLLHGEPIYDALLQRTLAGGNPSVPASERRNIIELTVCSGSMVDGKTVGRVTWPPHMILVDIKRGTDQLLPEQSTRLHAGDYIYVLTDDIEAASAVKDLVEREMHNNYKK